MPNLLTTLSTVTCGHLGGAVRVRSTAKLTVAGAPVLLAASVLGRTVAACGTQPASDPSGPTAIPCQTVEAITAGQATKLTVAGQPVLLDTLTGTTNGMVAKVRPQTLLSATANQAKARAV